MIKSLFFSLIILFSCTENKKADLNITYGDKFYKEGEKLILKNNVEAYQKFQIAINYYNKSKDSSNISKSLICQSIAQKYSGDINGAEATLVEALKMMKANDESLYSIYGNLGDLKYDQKEYSEATIWYNKALNENHNFGESKNNILNNKAASEFRQKKYSTALKTLQGIDTSKIGDLKLKYRIKENIEYIKWLKDNNYSAEKEIKKLLTLKLAANDYWGINSSYAHLAEIKQASDPNISLYYAKQMLDIARKNKSPEDRLEAISRIMLVDNSFNSKKNFHEYKNLSDSIQNSRDNYKTKFAYIKYDSKKKELENQRYKIKSLEDKNKILILLGALLLFIMIALSLFKRGKQLQQEKALEVKNTQLKISKKVHDVVANGIYQVMTKIENQESFDKDEALDELEFVYEKSRDISYEKEDSENPKEEFKEKISNLIASFKNSSVETYVAGNENEVWRNLSTSKAEDIYQIIRELLVNMKKHSKADRVAFKFERINNEINIQYKDNGIGIPGELIYKNGLSSTVSRMEKINGEITFDIKTEKGMKINISFPVSKKN